jgi:hypothetical protein
MDISPRSLLPTVGLSKRWGIWMQVAWFVAVLVAALARPEGPAAFLVRWVVGAYSLYYIAARLGGRPAQVPRVGAIDAESAFQARLVFDSLFIWLFLAIVASWLIWNI